MQYLHARPVLISIVNWYLPLKTFIYAQMTLIFTYVIDLG